MLNANYSVNFFLESESLLFFYGANSMADSAANSEMQTNSSTKQYLILKLAVRSVVHVRGGGCTEPRTSNNELNYMGLIT